MASSKETYCLCGQPYNIGQFMIECDCCREWFHGSCVDVKIYQSDDIDKYHCPKCVHIYGPSVLKIPTNNHRADRYEIGAESKPAQIGSPAWVRALAARPLRPMAAALQRMKGYQFTEEFVRDGGFVRPIQFSSPEGLEITTPNPATFTVRSVLRYCGAQLEVEVIDVRKQATLRMTLADFVDYFETPPEARVEKVLNVLSLEFSDTNLSPLVEPPAVAAKLDWAQTVWPSGEPPPKPSVQKYCLLSSAGSYTDWHLDFGGSTVWYHLLHGRKIFYLAPPTPANLTLYQQWSASSNRERFFGDMMEWYGTCELVAGQSLFIPSGWIHAVYTPTDSLVFGGNLLHSYSIESQLQVYEMERRVETPMMLRYPLFEPMCWYAAAHLLTLLHRHNEDSQDEDFRLSESDSRAPLPQLPPLLVKGVKVLANVLKEWHSLKSSDTAKRDNVPKCLNSGQLVRELAKELRIFEKRTSTVKDKEYKVKNNSTPKKHTKQNSQKKSLKLTLPKPIVTYSHNGEFIEENPPKEYKNYIEEKDIYQEQNYITEDLKYSNGLEEAKAFTIDGKPVAIDNKSYVYQNFDEHLPSYVETNGYIERHEKKNGGSVLRIKLSNNPSSSREAPPPYSLPEHSILKSHLIGRVIPQERLPQPPVKPLQQWTISKKELGEYQEEQILYTNENVQSVHQNVHSVHQNVQSLHQNVQSLHQNVHSVHQNVQSVHSVHQTVHSVHQNVQSIQGGVQTIQGNVQTPDMGYGPGMYSTEDIHQDYQYDAKPYQPDYSYQPNMPQPELGMAQQDLSMTQQDLTITQQDLTMAQQELTMGQQELPLTQPGLAMAQQYTVESPAYIATRYEVENIGHTHHHSHQNPTYQQIVNQDSMNGAFQEQLPTYDAAIAQQHYQTNTYVVEEQKHAPSVRRSVRAVRRRVSPTYEYSDAELYIDETPAATRRRKKNNYTHHAASSTSYRPPRGPRPAPANGIESLIQASQLAAEPNDTEDAAVAGMLSIGSRYTAPPPEPPPARTFGLASNTRQPDSPPPPPSKPTSPTKRSRGGAAVSKREEYASDEENDVIKEVHRDDEYVYPALDLSSDEDEEWTASKRSRGSRSRLDSRSKSEKDAAWSPRARVGRVVPRVRAARAARRDCVRIALTAARERTRRARTPPPPAHHLPPPPQSAKRAVLATKSKRPPAPVQTSPKNSNARLKKGMKTAKQRLGKILKLHKMMH